MKFKQKFFSILLFCFAGCMVFNCSSLTRQELSNVPDRKFKLTDVNFGYDALGGREPIVEFFKNIPYAEIADVLKKQLNIDLDYSEYTQPMEPSSDNRIMGFLLYQTKDSGLDFFFRRKVKNSITILVEQNIRPVSQYAKGVLYTVCISINSSNGSKDIRYWDPAQHPGRPFKKAYSPLYRSLPSYGYRQAINDNAVNAAKNLPKMLNLYLDTEYR